MDDWAPIGQQGNDWQPVGSPVHRSVMDQLLGNNGPRYQTWPEQAVRGLFGAATDAATLPGKYLQEATTPRNQISDSDVSVLSVPQAANFAGFASPMSPAASAGAGWAGVPLSRTERPPVPTATQLRDAGASGIEAAKNSGLDIKGQAVADWSRNLQQQLFETTAHPIQAPQTYTFLKELENAPPDAVFTGANLQALKERLGTAAQSYSDQFPKEQLAASRAVSSLKGLLPSVPSEGVLAGSPAATQKLFDQGWGDYAAAMRSNAINGQLDGAITGIEERAVNRAAAANSGRNLDNTIRQRVEGFLEKPSEVSGLNDAEFNALNNVVNPGFGARNTLRYTGKLLGGGGGLGQAVVSGAAYGGAGGVFGGPAGAAVGFGLPIAGAVATSASNKMTRGALNSADELIRQRSPLYESLLSNAPAINRPPSSVKAAIARALMIHQMQQSFPTQQQGQ